MVTIALYKSHSQTTQIVSLSTDTTPITLSIKWNTTLILLRTYIP